MKQYVLALLIAVFLSIGSLGVGMSVIDSASQIGEGAERTIEGNIDGETTGEEKSEVDENDVPDCWPIFGDVTVFKYWDRDGSGEYSDGDEPIEGWHFELYRKDQCTFPGPRGDEEEISGNPWYKIDDGWTDENGYHVFEIECNRHHKVREYLYHEGEDWYFTGGTVIGGSADGSGYDDFEIKDGYVEISFWDRCEDVEIWFGNAKEEAYGEITVYKFHDENYDGLYDPEEEELMDGFEFQLWYADEYGDPTDMIGDPVGTVEGMYTFEDLEPGNYVVEEIISDEVGEDGCNWVSTTGLLQYVEVKADGMHTLYFGNVHGGRIEGMKFLDIEADGHFDVGLDKPLMDWEIYLWTNEDGGPGERVATTTTDRSGEYYFDCVVPGEYFVQEEMYEGWYNVLPDVVPVYVEPCETVTDIDFANCMYKDIYGIKYFDSQQTGYFDQENDWVLGGWPIQLLNEEEEVIQTIETQPNGYYFFEGLTVGTYYVEELLPEDEDPEAWINTTDSRVEVVLNCCTPCTVVNFGNYKYPEITIVKFHDTNMDGIFDLDEELVLDEVWFNIDGYDDFGPFIPYDLQVFGEWSFYTDEGRYTITEILPDGWLNTTPLVQSFSLGPADEITVEFGNVQYGHIEVCKFYDENMNSEWDDGEDMLSGWEFYLWTTDEDGSLDEIIRTNETGECGCFVFEDLIPGLYAVQEIEQAGWFPTTDLIQYVEIEAGETGEVWFGNVPGGTIEGYKYCDYEMVGEYYEGIIPIEDWTIYLYRVEDEEPYMTTETDEDGYYSFEYLDPQIDYIVEEEMPEDWYSVGESSYHVELGPEATEVRNFFNYQHHDITGIKFYDFTMSGEFEPKMGDIPLRNKLIKLYEGDEARGTPIDTTYTDEHGYYSFEYLQPGEYTVEQEKTCCYWEYTIPRIQTVEIRCDDVEVNFAEWRWSTIDVYVECGAEGVGVEIWSYEDGEPGEPIDSGLTGDHGWYISIELEPGWYWVELMDGQYEIVQLRNGEQVEFGVPQTLAYGEAIDAKFE